MAPSEAPQKQRDALQRVRLERRLAWGIALLLGLACFLLPHLARCLSPVIEGT